MNFLDLIKPITDEIKNVDKVIQSYLNSDVVLINTISEYIINSGGKRLRPLVLLLIAKSLGYKGHKHYSLAAVIEFIHTATLLHDDVIDNSSMRRGKKSSNIMFGNSYSILVGDYLYSRAFEIMVSANSQEIIKILSEATTTIARGEVMQLLNINNPELSEQEYFNVIKSKTAKLFEASSHIGAILSKSKNKESAISYGSHIGIAFQLMDDILDYTGDKNLIGKNLGDDLKEGKITLPLIRALQVTNVSNKDIICNAIINGNESNFPLIYKIIHETDAIEYTLLEAERHSKIARESIKDYPNTIYKCLLIELTNYSVKRKS